MTSRVLRWEPGTDSNGNDEIFVCVEITDGTDIYTYAEWLTPSDVAIAIANSNNIDLIASQVAQRGVDRRPSNLATETTDDSAFSLDQFFVGFNSALTAIERLNFSLAFPTFIDEIKNQDFTGIKTVLDYLLMNAKITQATVDKITPLFIVQGVNLESLR